MAGIRNYQTDFLRRGAEQINYKVFDSDGTYVETLDENILINCPTDVVPLNRSLVKLYEKPLYETVFKTKLAELNYVNQNSQFLYDDDGWVLASAGSNNTAGEVGEHTFYNVKPLSGNKFYRANGGGVSATMLKTKLSENSIRQNIPLNIGFFYYFKSTSITTYYYHLTVKLDASGNGTLDHIYNFRDDVWESGTTVLGKNIYQIDGGAVGIWNGFSVDLTPFVYDTDDNAKNVEIAISFPANASTFDSTFIDNFTIGEKVSINFNEVTCKRRRFSYDGGFTGKYETTNIMSNELADDDNFTGQIEGSYERPRDTNPKTLEAIITQEIMNDSRDYMTKYEGVFRNIDSTNIGLHNKIWIDFGTDNLQEPVSGYIDAMKFDVKAGEYDIKMHIPNQDDDVNSTYEVVAE